MGKLAYIFLLWVEKYLFIHVFYIFYIDGLAQDCRNSIANAFELLHSCIKSSTRIHVCLQTRWSANRSVSLTTGCVTWRIC